MPTWMLEEPTNRIITSFLQISMWMGIVAVFRHIWAMEREDPFIIPYSWTHWREIRAAREAERAEQRIARRQRRRAAAKRQAELADIERRKARVQPITLANPYRR